MKRDTFPSVVVITGASAGVGRATAREFARMGCSIGLIARDEERLASTAQEVESLGGRALPLSVDVADAEQVEDAARQVEDRLGPIDVWVNNAMTSVFGSVEETSEDEFKRVLEVTYLGYVYGTKAALRRMAPRNRGAIVQVGSALAYRGIPLQAAYCSAKHAIQGFTDSLRTELLHDRSSVRVVMAQMPALNTPQFEWVRSKLPRRAKPVPPIFQPEVAAEAIVAAAISEKREVFVGGSTWKVILFNRLFPGLADRYLARTGYDSQQTDEAEAEERPDNLYNAPPGGYAAHGRFDTVAKRASVAWWTKEHRGGLLAGAALLGAGYLAAQKLRYRAGRT